MSLEVLVVTRGHAFDHNAFLEMFDAMPGVNPTLVDQPAAQIVLQPESAGEYDAVLFYDMSGIPGIGLVHDRAGADGAPPERFRIAVEGLLARGTGLVLLNHATVSWPYWPLWRRISGTSFMLRQGTLDGTVVPGSGYRGGHGPLPNATVHLHPQGNHPVLDGLEAGFEITDELYLKTTSHRCCRSCAPGTTSSPVTSARRRSHLLQNRRHGITLRAAIWSCGPTRPARVRSWRPTWVMVRRHMPMRAFAGYCGMR